MASKKTKKARYGELRSHTARVVKLASYPMHVNGAYLDDPEHITTLSPPRPKE